MSEITRSKMKYLRLFVLEPTTFSFICFPFISVSLFPFIQSFTHSLVIYTSVTKPAFFSSCRLINVSEASHARQLSSHPVV